jgi:hypothetical protein
MSSSYESMLLCERAESENQAVLDGAPLAIYGQFLPDPRFCPPEIPLGAAIKAVAGVPPMLRIAS